MHASIVPHCVQPTARALGDTYPRSCCARTCGRPEAHPRAIRARSSSVGARTDPPFGQPNQDTLVGAEQAHNSLGYTLLFVLLSVQQVRPRCPESRLAAAHEVGEQHAYAPKHPPHYPGPHGAVRDRLSPRSPRRPYRPPYGRWPSRPWTRHHARWWSSWAVVRWWGVFSISYNALTSQKVTQGDHIDAKRATRTYRKEEPFGSERRDRGPERVLLDAPACGGVGEGRG